MRDCDINNDCDSSAPSLVRRADEFLHTIATQSPFRDSQPPRRRPPTGDCDHVTLELGWELLGHGSILPARTGLAKAMSTKPGADPSVEIQEQQRGVVADGYFEAPKLELSHDA